MTLLGKVLPHQVGGVPGEPIGISMSLEEAQAAARKAIEEAFAEPLLIEHEPVAEFAPPSDRAPPSAPASSDEPAPSNVQRPIVRDFARLPDGVDDLRRYRPPRHLGVWSG
jgi:hypothetical protein